LGEELECQMIETSKDSLTSIAKMDKSISKGPFDTNILGMSSSHEHYIKPVPPFYVTEYEASYTWPEVTPEPGRRPEVFPDFKRQKPTVVIQKPAVISKGIPDTGEDFENTGDILPLKPQRLKFEHPWTEMEEALEELKSLEMEKGLASRVKPEVIKHKLNDKIEQAYTHYKKKLSSLTKEHPHPHGITEQIIEKMQSFCDSVEAVKQAHYRETEF
jgi:hypothetical protein